MSVVHLLAESRSTAEQLMYVPSEQTDHGQLLEMHTAFAQALFNAHQNKDAEVTGFQGPLCSVDYDNTQLRWGREGVPLCTAEDACVALSMTHNQGVLHSFLLPGQDPATGSLCLLCTRLHAQLMNDSYETIDPKGTAPLILPPMTNLVDCPGGYSSFSLGVTPQNQRCFSRTTSIVGASPLLSVRYSPLTETWWVDQEKLIWRPAPAEQ